MKFRKKPFDVEAWKNTAGSVPPYWLQEYVAGNAGSILFIPILGGMKRVDPEDWVVINDKGMMYPCKPDVFEEIYEAVE